MKHLVLSLFILLLFLLTASVGVPIDHPSKNSETLTATELSASEQNNTTPSTISVKQTPPASQTSLKENAESMRWIFWRLLAPILLGGMGATVINIYWSNRTRKREFVGLLLILTAEFVTSLNRCVTFYDQLNKPKREVSYSSLFALSDASVLSRFATSARNADLVIAAMNLKSHFFQIERHAETASRCIIEARTTHDADQAISLESKSLTEQGAAVGFFLSPYDEIVRDLSLLLDASEKLAKGPLATDLRKKFQTAIEKKKTIDSNIQNKEQAGYCL